MHAGLEVNIPNYATAIVSADEIVETLSTLGQQLAAVTPAGAAQPKPTSERLP
jgi:hypothetical protein